MYSRQPFAISRCFYIYISVYIFFYLDKKVSPATRANLMLLQSLVKLLKSKPIFCLIEKLYNTNLHKKQVMPVGSRPYFCLLHRWYWYTPYKSWSTKLFWFTTTIVKTTEEAASLGKTLILATPLYMTKSFDPIIGF